MDLGGDLGNLGASKIDILVNDVLIQFVDLGQAEEGNECQNDEGETIEPGSEVSEEVQKCTELG